MFAELFGNLLAREIGVSTPKPALVVLTDPFVRTVQPFLPTSIQLRVGYGVGCEYISPFPPLLSDYQLPLPIRSHATLIYALDLVTANFDRRVGNPNCALWQSDLLAYDFECSFSFLQALFGPKPWLVSRLGIAQHHIFQSSLKTTGADWTPFIDKFKLIDERRMEELVKDFPVPWLANSERVFNYLLEAQSQERQLVVELEASLHVQSPPRR